MRTLLLLAAAVAMPAAGCRPASGASDVAGTYEQAVAASASGSAAVNRLELAADGQRARFLNAAEGRAYADSGRWERVGDSVFVWMAKDAGNTHSSLTFLVRSDSLIAHGVSPMESVFVRVRAAVR